MDESISEGRKRLYNEVSEEIDSQYKNYQKYYYASNTLLKWGKRLDYVVTIFGVLLLFLVGGVLTEKIEFNSNVSLVSFGITFVLTTLSFIKAKEGFSRSSSIYYNAGQVHQELFQDFRSFIVEQVPNPDRELDELISEFEELLKRKNELNRATPQLRDRWYLGDRLVKGAKEEQELNLDLPDICGMYEGEWEPE